MKLMAASMSLELHPLQSVGPFTGPRNANKDTRTMTTLNDFEFLPITFFSQSLEAIRDVLVNQILPKWGHCSVSSGSFRLPFEREPQYSGTHDVDAVFFTTRAAPGYIAFMANLQDGWSSLAHVISAQLPGRVLVCALAMPTHAYPANSMHILEGGETMRLVRAMKDDPRWEFYEEGEVQTFENAAYYTRRYTRDRVNHQIMVEYLNKLGIRIDDPQFWQVEGEVLHVHKSRPKRD
jgi:hypothetical protein